MASIEPLEPAKPPAPAPKSNTPAPAVTGDTGVATGTQSISGKDEKGSGPKSPEAEPEAAKRVPGQDPIVFMLEKLRVAASEIPPGHLQGLTKGIERLAKQSSEVGRTADPLFRTQVAYVLQDMEKFSGRGTTSMANSLREEMTNLAATAPGLTNPDLKSLIASTPSITSPELIGEIRRLGRNVGMEAEQGTPAIRDRIDALASRVSIDRGDPPKVEVAQTDPAPGTVAKQGVQAVQAAEKTQTSTSETRTSASPGGDKAAVTPGEAQGPRAEHAQADTHASPGVRGQTAHQPKNLMSAILDGMRGPSSNSPPPWAPPPIAMAERVTTMQRALDQGKTDQLIRVSEKSGVEFMKAVETFSSGPGAGVLGKIDAAASTEVGGIKAVMGEMQPGGRYATLRKEFDSALQSDRAFAASFAEVEKTGGQYGRNRVALEANLQANGLSAKQIDARFETADAALGEASSKIPGRQPGQSVMDEMGQKIGELLSKAVQSVKSAFGYGAEPERRPSASAGASM